MQSSGDTSQQFPMFRLLSGPPDPVQGTSSLFLVPVNDAAVSQNATTTITS